MLDPTSRHTSRVSILPIFWGKAVSHLKTFQKTSISFRTTSDITFQKQVSHFKKQVLHFKKQIRYHITKNRYHISKWSATHILCISSTKTGEIENSKKILEMCLDIGSKHKIKVTFDKEVSLYSHIPFLSVPSHLHPSVF